MNKILWIFISSLIAFSCQSNNNDFRIEGQLNGLSGDTIYFYNLEKDSVDIDTILIENDKFIFQAKIDTTSYFSMFFPKHNFSLPVFVDKRLKINIKADTLSFATISVNGGDFNDELTEFRKTTFKVNDQDSLQIRAEQYIKENPYSRVSIYLLHQFFVLQQVPDYNKIQELINSMSGELKDVLYIKRLTERIEKLQESSISKRAPSFSMKNTKDETISLSSTTFRSKYVLLHFWASWSENSLLANESIKKIRKQYSKKDIEFIGISLDYDKTKWLEQIKKDTLSWEQINDFNGWENSVAKQYGILDIPANILISPQRTIIERDLTEEELITKLEEVFSNSQQTTNKN